MASAKYDSLCDPHEIMSLATSGATSLRFLQNVNLVTDTGFLLTPSEVRTRTKILNPNPKNFKSRTHILRLPDTSLVWDGWSVVTKASVL